jgi:hypothetical protein
MKTSHKKQSQKMYIQCLDIDINTFYYIFLDPEWVKHI